MGRVSAASARLRRSPRLTALARGVRDFVRGPAPAPPLKAARVERVDDTVRELIRVTPRPSPRSGPRLNLLLPTLAATSTFGGIRTALGLFEAIGDGFPERRIVALEPLDATSAQAAVPGYAWLEPGEDGPAPLQVTTVGQPAGGTLAVGPDDRFVATFWSSAELAVRIRTWQRDTFGRVPDRWAYAIQDHEPAFYPSSARSELARATYDDPAATVAIFNTALLQQAFHDLGIRFDHEFAFEPRLPGALRAALDRPAGSRDRRIVVYGRPRTPRNAFPALVDGLRAWRASDPRAAQWELVSAGQAHPPIELGGGGRLESLGKLDLEAYAELLRTSAVGVSLMVSPHPSYPPLEMAHLGMLVLTNRFGPKDLSSWHPNIRSLDGLAAETIAAGLTERCRAFEDDPSAGDRAATLRPDYLSTAPQFPFGRQVAELLGGSTAV